MNKVTHNPALKTSYNKTLIVGAGRLAKHLSRYLNVLKVPYVTWTRRSGEDFEQKLEGVDRVCLCLPDSALVAFVQKYPQLTKALTIHFSAVTDVPGAYWAHPLMTFGPELYDDRFYPAIPFVLDENGPVLNQLFPEFKNPSHRLRAEKRGLYHALCVLSGNFTTILWQAAMRRFESDLNLDGKILEPYLQQVMSNLLSRPEEALTGPLARNDTATIVRHLDSLRGKPEQNLYYAFLNYVLADRKSRGEVTHDRLSI